MMSPGGGDVTSSFPHPDDYDPIAPLAVVMGALSALQRPFFDNMVAFTAALVFLVAAAVAILVLVVVSVVRFVVDVFVYAVHFWLGRTRTETKNGSSAEFVDGKTVSSLGAGSTGVRAKVESQDRLDGLADCCRPIVTCPPVPPFLLVEVFFEPHERQSRMKQGIRIYKEDRRNRRN